MDTRRPTVPAAEEILGGYYPVLDHGFVSLVDYMGSDEDVEQAARVSYGYGTRRTAQTRGLIRYLRRHHHTTPSEMVELKFHCVMPIFVARQWVRHRTACLAAGTQLYFDLPGGLRRQGRQLYTLPIEEIWQRFQPTANRTRPDKQRNPFVRRDRLRAMRLRQLNEDTGRIQHTRTVDVFRNGAKPVFRMTLADGKTIECTADHRFLFAEEWKTLAEAVGLREIGGRAYWNAGDHFLHVNGIVIPEPAMYQDREWLEEQYHILHRPFADIAEDCVVTYHTIWKWLRKHDLTEPGRGPWNRGRKSSLGPRDLGPEWLESVRRARSGSASNFWKGGVSSDRESIGRWTTQAAPRIHARNGWTCQHCGERPSELHCHHIVPVWADASRARDESNLTTLCGVCHRQIAGRNLGFVERLGGPPLIAHVTRKPRVAWNRAERSRLTRIEGFEYVGVKETYDVEVEGPHHNLVANGIITHNSVNELSARYSLMPLLFYRPDEEQFALQSRSNRQGRKGGAPEAVYEEAVRRWDALRQQAGGGYAWMLEEDVARELARIDLPLSTYTQWYWKIDLHNLLHFLTLRVDPRAQWEIQEYACVMAAMMKRVAPLSYEAWIDYDLCARSFTRAERDVLARLVRAGEDSVRALEGAALSRQELGELGLSAREIAELIDKLDAPERPDFELDLARMRTAEDVAREMAEAVPGTTFE